MYTCGIWKLRFSAQNKLTHNEVNVNADDLKIQYECIHFIYTAKLQFKYTTVYDSMFYVMWTHMK